MSVSLNGFNENVATFTTEDSNVAAGDPVVICGNLQVEKAASGEAFDGICTSIREGIAGVKLCGYSGIPYSGSAPSFGKQKLAADGNGGVSVNDAGTECTVVLVDQAAKICGIIL